MLALAANHDGAGDAWVELYLPPSAAAPTHTPASGAFGSQRRTPCCHSWIPASYSQAYETQEAWRWCCMVRRTQQRRRRAARDVRVHSVAPCEL